MRCAGIFLIPIVLVATLSILTYETITRESDTGTFFLRHLRLSSRLLLLRRRHFLSLPPLLLRRRRLLRLSFGTSHKDIFLPLSE